MTSQSGHLSNNFLTNLDLMEQTHSLINYLISLILYCLYVRYTIVLGSRTLQFVLGQICLKVLNLAIYEFRQTYMYSFVTIHSP